MKKFKLSTEDLNVESFLMQKVTPFPGTVQAHQEPLPGEPEEPIEEDGLWSWLAGTCDPTCKLSCGGAAPTYCNSNYCKNHPPKDGEVAITLPDAF